jgi:hypothetical protein
MIAIASWVRGLAVPKPPPGPCDAKAASVDSKTAIAGIAAEAARDIRSLVRKNVMTISCERKLQKIRR